MKNRARRICSIYKTLLETFGPQGWWPSETTFETAIGAVLTQNTAWTNAERAIDNLRAADVLTPDSVWRTPHPMLSRLIRPAGFPKQKTKSLKELAALARRQPEGWEGLLALEPDRLRRRLLTIPGIGPETADVILLYAAGRPVFVADAYARRLAARHGLVRHGAGYEEVKAVFEEALPPDPELMNEYHALIVRLGKEFCRARPRCAGCPLQDDLRRRRRAASERRQTGPGGGGSGRQMSRAHSRKTDAR